MEIEKEHKEIHNKLIGNVNRISKKLRQGKNELNQLSPEVLNMYDNFSEKIEEIWDWYRSIQPEISSYDAQRAINTSDEWHKMIAGQGEGVSYEPTQQDMIVYGPQWKNPEWQGWTVQKVISENDLLAEGNKMDHCVGSFCEDVERQHSIIYSLRDPQNNPHVTILFQKIIIKQWLKNGYLPVENSRE